MTSAFADGYATSVRTAAYVLAEAAYYKVAAVAPRSSDASVLSTRPASEATHIGTDPHEFIDTLGPYSPRSKP